MRWRVVAFSIAGWLCAAPVLGQDISQTEMKAADVARTAQKAGRYLDAADALRPLAFKADGTPTQGFAYAQWEEAETWMRGEPPHAARRDKSEPDKNADRLRAATAHDAIAEITARARKTRVVFLNEDHGTPRSRAFALEVARALRPLGYSLLAVETLTNRPDDAASAKAMQKVASDGYVRRSSGYYTADPVFADFLRQSLSLGYRPVAYESTTFHPKASQEIQIAMREQAQADYLIRRALKARPQAKLFVYVGFSHAAEEPLHNGRKTPTRWFANRFKIATGINPLTIDQTTLGENASYEHSNAYHLIADKANGRSIVPFIGDKPLVIGQYEGAVDLQVVHPRTRHIGSRPAWLLAMRRTATPIPRDMLPAKGVRLVQAFVASEADDTIPVDQVLVTAGMPPPMLMLPKVPVRFAYQDPAASAR